MSTTRNTTVAAVGTVLSRAEALLLALMSSGEPLPPLRSRTYPGGTAAAVATVNRKARVDRHGQRGLLLDHHRPPAAATARLPRDLVTMVEGRDQSTP